MPLFLVKWDINLEADTAEDAARQALEIQRDPESIATVFNVKDTKTGRVVVIDTQPDNTPTEPQGE